MFYAGVHGRKYIFQLWQKRPTELPFRRRVIHRFCCHTLALAASAATKLIHLVTFHSPTLRLLTSSPFLSMSFATLVALRLRNTASAAKGMTCLDHPQLDSRPNLNHRWANSLAPFLSPPDDCLLELPPSIHAYTSTPRCASPRGPAVLPSPLPQEQ